MSNALNKVLLGKIETTVGTDAAPTAAANAIRLISASLTPVSETVQNKGVKQTFGDMPHHQIDKSLQLDVEFYIRSGGALGAVPDFASILHAANHTVTNVANTSVTIAPYTGIGSARHTASFYYYEDGLLWKLIGAMATMKIDAPLDGWVKVTASIYAPHTVPTAAALPAGLSYQSSLPLVADNNSVITDSGAPVQIGAFAFDSSAAVEVRRMIGLSEARMTARDKPAITFTKASLSTAADYTRLTAMTDGAFSSVFGNAGNRVTLTAPRARLESVKPSEDGVNMTRDISLALYETAGGGDDAYSIVLD